MTAWLMKLVLPSVKHCAFISSLLHENSLSSLCEEENLIRVHRRITVLRRIIALFSCVENMLGKSSSVGSMCYDRLSLLSCLAVSPWTISAIKAQILSSFDDGALTVSDIQRLLNTWLLHQQIPPAVQIWLVGGNPKESHASSTMHRVTESAQNCGWDGKRPP